MHSLLMSFEKKRTSGSIRYQRPYAAISAPSTRISLVELRPRKNRLCFSEHLDSSAQSEKEKCKQSDTELCLQKSRGLGQSPSSEVVSVRCPFRTVHTQTRTVKCPLFMGKSTQMTCPSPTGATPVPPLPARTRGEGSDLGFASMTCPLPKSVTPVHPSPREDAGRGK